MFTSMCAYYVMRQQYTIIPSHFAKRRANIAFRELKTKVSSLEVFHTCYTKKFYGYLQYLN